MDTFRKWLNKPKADDKSLLARFYHADRSLTAVASELDSFDGRAEPDRCSRLVSRLRQGQDKVLAITNLIMEELLGEDRDARAFRAKFPEEVLQENLAGQLWFGAECLAAGSSIMNREQESKEMRPLAQAVTKSLGNVRSLLREQCLRNNVPNSLTLHLDINDSTTEQLYESLKIFDRLFAEFELRYVSAMVQVKTKHEYEMQEMICVLFSETLQRSLKVGLLDQEKVDAFDPALMFSIPRLAIIAGLVIYPKGPLNMDMPAEELSEMFRPFRSILIKIRDKLRSLSRSELFQLQKLLCTNEDINLNIPLGSSSIEAPISSSQQNNNNNNNNSHDITTTTASSSTNTKNEDNNKNHNQQQQQQQIQHRQKVVTEPKQTNSNNTITTTTTSTASRKKLLKRQTPNSSSRYSSRSPSISPVSCESETPSSLISPSPSPTPSQSTASTLSEPTSSITSPVDEEWSDDDTDIDSSELQKELDMVSADCASGYLIPNTNFGNLLQPQGLTDNFVASDDEYGPATNVQDFADMPTTSASILRRDDGVIQLQRNASLDDSELNKSKQSNSEKLEKFHDDDDIEDRSIASGNSNSSNCCSKGDSSHHRHQSGEHCCTSKRQSSSETHRHHRHHHYHHHHRHRNRHHHKSRHCRGEECADKEHWSKHENKNVQTSTKNESMSTGSSSTSSSHSEGDGGSYDVTNALRTSGRIKCKSNESLLHRLFVCVAGVADQLQTNFASDLRQILRSVFLMNMSIAQEEDLDIPEKSKDSDLFEFRASENDVIQESGGSNQSIYSAEEVNPELDNVFNNNNNNNNGDNNSSNSNSNSNSNSSSSSNITRGEQSNISHVGRSRSLDDDVNNSSLASTSSNNHLSANLASRSLATTSRHQRNRNNSVGSNYTSSSASSENNSPVSGRITGGFSERQSNNNSNNSLQAPPPTFMNQSTTRLAPPAWIPDERAPRCMSCRTPFTAFRRRHHCRNCGGVFCGVCSNASAPLPKYGLTKAVRVCRECYVQEFIPSPPHSRANVNATTARAS